MSTFIKHAQAVVSGAVTEFRIPVARGDESNGSEIIRNGGVLVSVGEIYPVRTARGKQAANIRITSIREEDVLHMTSDDAQASGSASVREFWQTWAKKCDPTALKPGIPLEDRPAEKWTAWVIAFEVVEG